MPSGTPNQNGKNSNRLSSMLLLPISLSENIMAIGVLHLFIKYILRVSKLFLQDGFLSLLEQWFDFLK